MTEQTQSTPIEGDEVRALRQRRGLSQSKAAEVVLVATRTWQQWESGRSRMHPAFVELFRLKTELQAAPKPEPAAQPAPHVWPERDDEI